MRQLECRLTDISEAFARDVVLQAVRANTSLRKLEASDLGWKTKNEVGKRKTAGVAGGRGAGGGPQQAMKVNTMWYVTSDLTKCPPALRGCV